MEKTQNKFLSFVKRNAFYLILALCIVAVGVSLLLVLTGGESNLGDQAGIENPVDEPTNNPNDNPSDTPVDTPNDNPSDTPVDTPNDNPSDTPVVKPMTFIMPVESVSSIVEYSEQMVFNSTLKRYSTHMAIDFITAEGTKVLAVADGVIKDVQTSILKGTSVTIDHGNGLLSTYNSLLDGESVTVGQTVKQGDVIGLVSSTNRQEADKGAHLHFEVSENGEIINPEKYLDLDNK